MKLGILASVVISLGAVLALAPVIARASVFRSKVETTIDIDAPPEIVWKVLVDFKAYPEWNPFFQSVTGTAKAGNKLNVVAHLVGAKSDMRFSPKVEVADAGRELRWLGRLLLPGIFDGRHVFLIEQTSPSHVRLHHGESFSGLAVPLAGRGMFRKTKLSFEAMNAALKSRAETIAASARK